LRNDTYNEVHPESAVCSYDLSRSYTDSAETVSILSLCEHAGIVGATAIGIIEIVDVAIRLRAKQGADNENAEHSAEAMLRRRCGVFMFLLLEPEICCPVSVIGGGARRGCGWLSPRPPAPGLAFSPL